MECPSLRSSLLSSKDASMPRSRSNHRYTYGDAFCGAGGTARGACHAGLKIKGGFDYDKDAITAYAANFGQTNAHHVDGFDFCTKEGSSRTHLSIFDLF